MNRTLMERARSMLKGVTIEKKFWAEEVSIKCYLTNRFPTLALVDKTHMEVWMGKKLSLQHLRLFGCEAYTHVPKEKWLQLDSKVVKCIFIGYGVGVKGYKLWNPMVGNFLSQECYFRKS
jgi:hypothetical protein